MEMTAEGEYLRTQRNLAIALDNAILNGRTSDCRALLASGEIDLTWPYGECFHNALANAAQNRQTDICKLLIDAGFAVNVVNPIGFSPLHMAQSYNAPEIVDLLLASGASPSFLPERAQSDYLTPFQSAVASCRNREVERYVRECGEDLGQRTLKKRTLLQLAGSPATRALLHALKTEQAVTAAAGIEPTEPAPAASRRAGIAPI